MAGDHSVSGVPIEPDDTVAMMDEDDDVVIEAVCHPNWDRPEMQSISISANVWGEDQRLGCSLEALRFAQVDFSLTDLKSVVTAFDEQSSFAFGLATETLRMRRTLMKRYIGERTCGFIGITTIRTAPWAAGHQLGLKLLNYLRQLHAGMTWYAALQAAPMDLRDDDRAEKAMRRRLIKYYGSDPELGLIEDAPRSSPGLMTALWHDPWPTWDEE